MTESSAKKPFKWSSDLDVGVEGMNDDHQRIIEMMNHLYAITSTGAPRQEIEAAVDSLANFAVEHFTREEEFLDSIAYAGTKQHKEVHKNLLQRFAYQRKEFFDAGCPPDSKFFHFLEVWLMSHIKGIDTQYANVAKQRAS